MKTEGTREMIKLAARRLFASRGVDGVSVREIVAATGQRNGGSLHYYFRSKEALVRELIIDGARLIDDRRNAALDRLEAEGGPRTVREALEILVWPATNLGEADGEEDTYLRFLSFLSLQQRSMLDEVLGETWNTGYQRCLAHIRRLATGVPGDVLEKRLVFMSISLRAIMASREAALEGGRDHPFWTVATMDSLLDALDAMLRGPPHG